MNMKTFYIAPDAELIRFKAAEAIAEDNGLSVEDPMQDENGEEDA